MKADEKSEAELTATRATVKESSEMQGASKRPRSQAPSSRYRPRGPLTAARQVRGKEQESVDISAQFLALYTRHLREAHPGPCLVHPSAGSRGSVLGSAFVCFCLASDGFPVHVASLICMSLLAHVGPQSHCQRHTLAIPQVVYNSQCLQLSLTLTRCGEEILPSRSFNCQRIPSLRALQVHHGN